MTMPPDLAMLYTNEIMFSEKSEYEKHNHHFFRAPWQRTQPESHPRMLAGKTQTGLVPHRNAVARHSKHSDLQRQILYLSESN